MDASSSVSMIDTSLVVCAASVAFMNYSAVIIDPSIFSLTESLHRLISPSVRAPVF